MPENRAFLVRFDKYFPVPEYVSEIGTRKKGTTLSEQKMGGGTAHHSHRHQHDGIRVLLCRQHREIGTVSIFA